jgi:hypothetical protein
MKNYILSIMGVARQMGVVSKLALGVALQFFILKKKKKKIKILKIKKNIYNSHASADVALTLHRANVTLLHRYLFDNMVRR